MSSYIVGKIPLGSNGIPEYRLSSDKARINTVLSGVLLYGVSSKCSWRYSWRVTAPRFSATASSRLGKNIARLRRALGVSQDTLAERLGITTRHMQKIEAGEHAPSLPLLLTLHKKLGAEWDDIFTGL